MPIVKDRPLIGINTDYRANVKGRSPHSLMHSGYYDVILSANAIPVLIPPVIREHELTPILDRLDGVMLTGGDDLDPKKMGLAPHPSVTVMPERRETSDRLLCKLLQQRKITRTGRVLHDELRQRPRPIGDPRSHRGRESVRFRGSWPWRPRTPRRSVSRRRVALRAV